MGKTTKKIFRPIEIIIPVLIGIAVVAWLFAEDIGKIQFSEIVFSWRWIVAFAIAIIMIVGREWGYMLRYRLLTNSDLNNLQAFRVTMLCEFSSCITPSSVGGSSLAMVFMKREGINVGRGTAIVLITLFLDELFFVISCPLIFIFTPASTIFASISKTFGTGLQWTFWGVYALIAAWTIVLYIGIFHKPHYIKALLLWIFKLPVLKKWRGGIIEFGDHLVETSISTRNNSFKWWLKGFGATAISWISRYLLVSAIFYGIIGLSDEWLIFARQAVVWLLLLVTPTPGGSGISEWLFTTYYSDLVTNVGISLMIALIWRILSYYLYLIIGILVIPSWLHSKHKKSKS